jgi:hypothetical protein
VAGAGAGAGGGAGTGLSSSLQAANKATAQITRPARMFPPLCDSVVTDKKREIPAERLTKAARALLNAEFRVTH